MSCRLLILLAICCAAWPQAHAARQNSALNGIRSSDEPGPPAYELRLARYSDSSGADASYVFTIGDVAYKTVDALKQGIAQLPAGALLQWIPGPGRWGNEPLLSNPAELAAFSAYCKSLGIKFIFIPSE